jgi:hypothetical protein
MGLTRWWQYGLVGGVVLSLATLVKAVRGVARGAVGAVDWADAAGFAAAVFGMGFACGLVVWAGRGISRRLGLVGDAVVGLAVMLVFFTACMLVFDPELLGRKWWSGGLPMLGLGAVLGLAGGAWIGRDLRGEWAARKGPPPDGPAGGPDG